MLTTVAQAPPQPTAITVTIAELLRTQNAGIMCVNFTLQKGVVCSATGFPGHGIYNLTLQAMTIQELHLVAVYPAL